MKFWTQKEDAFLLKNLNVLTSLQIGEVLGRTKTSVQNRITKRGIYRTDEARERMKKLSRYKKGHVPWTKGKRGLHFSAATEFKTGHTPHNTKHDGCVSVRLHKKTEVGYKWIRISNNKWELYHRYTWEQHNGPVPPAHIIGFINGDTLDHGQTFRKRQLYRIYTIPQG